MINYIISMSKIFSNNVLVTFFFFKWCPDAKVGTLYLIYRLFMAALFIAIVVSHVISCGTGAKWLIFMTDLGVMFLALHYSIDAVIVVCRWVWEKNNPKAHCKYSFSSWLFKKIFQYIF